MRPNDSPALFPAPNPVICLDFPQLNMPPRPGVTLPSSGIQLPKSWLLCPVSTISPPLIHTGHLILQASLSRCALSLLPHSLPGPPKPSLTHPSLIAGEITTTSLLDRETKSEYILIVRAVDGGVGHNQKTGIATVSLQPAPAPSSPLATQAAASSSSSTCIT